MEEKYETEREMVVDFDDQFGPDRNVGEYNGRSGRFYGAKWWTIEDDKGNDIGDLYWMPDHSVQIDPA